MGTCFTAVVNHNLDQGLIYSLPELLNRTWPTVQPLLPLIEGYPVPGTSPREWKWSERDRGFSLERLLSNDTATMEGLEFEGIVSKHVLRVCHALKWSSFLTNQTTRGKVRQVCRHIASTLGSKQIVYIPSGFLKPEGALGLMYQGKVVEDMIDWLLKNCGPAPETFDPGLEQLENWYYIESAF